MEKYKTIHDAYQALYSLSSPFFKNKDEDELYLYISTCATKIWSQNDKRYSPDYIEAIKACKGFEHSESQMRAAITTLADPRFYPQTPDCFANMVKDDLQNSGGLCDKFLADLQTLLLGLAQSNGDFTFAEASIMDEIVSNLISYCYSQGLKVSAKKIDFPKYLTELNLTSYEDSSESSDNVTFDMDRVDNRDNPKEVAYHISFHNDKNDPANGESAGKKKTSEDEKKHDDALDACLSELYNLTGLRAVKEEITDLVNLTRVQQIRTSHGLSNADVSLHLVFAGNPGTGKTTVARILAKIYKALGILRTDTLIEVDRSGLVAGYIGQTALKTKEVIDSAIGGVLFIDEAYALTSSSFDNDYGKEAIDTLLKAMEDHRDELVVIVAGYTDLMGGFIESNPGLKSRFNRYIYFEDYTPQELLEIFHNQAAKNDYLLDAGCDDLLITFFSEMEKSGMAAFGNARGARNLFEKTITVQAARIVTMSDPTADDVQKVLISDVQNAIISYR